MTLRYKYFALYDLLPSDIAERAKENFEEEDIVIPDPEYVRNALDHGFDWEGSREGREYWDAVYIGNYGSARELLKKNSMEWNDIKHKDAIKGNKLLLCFYPNGSDNWSNFKLVWSSNLESEIGVTHYVHVSSPQIDPPPSLEEAAREAFENAWEASEEHDLQLCLTLNPDADRIIQTCVSFASPYAAKAERLERELQKAKAEIERMDKMLWPYED